MSDGHPGGAAVESRSTSESGLTGLNELPAAEAERLLLSCCGSPVWARTVAASRPFSGLAALLAAAERASAELPWPEVQRALSAHPRIGERARGHGREAGWSRREQSGMDGADSATLAALAAGNAEYESRFGHVYLVRAAGRPADELLALLRQRLTNDLATERATVRSELGQIARLRLTALAAG